jgi:rare lipoprotein A
MIRIKCLGLVALVALGGCAYMPLGESQRIQSSAPPPAQREQQRYAARQDRPRMSYKVTPGEVDPKTQPYSVMGKTYWPVQSAMGFKEEGFASWYGIDFHGKKTATGEIYDMFGVSAAHKTLPLGSKVRVTNMDNGRAIELTINDRGPFVDGRIIDLSYASARVLGMAENGLAHVRVEGIEDNPVIARGGYNALAVASAEGAPRNKRKGVVERDLDDGPGRAAVKPAKSAPALVQKAPDKNTGFAPAMAQADGQFCVQVGAFSLDDNARRVKDHLVQAGFRGARVVRAQRGDRELSVVQAGVFPGREEAEAVLREVRQEFPSSFIHTGA